MTSEQVPVPGGPVLYAGAALADGLGPALRTPVSVAVDDGLVTGIFDGDGAVAADQVGPGTRVVDASGASIVPGLVDCHSHLTLQGGAQWIERGSDQTPDLVDAAERNAAALVQAGVRWVRDVGSPRRADGGDGRERALALGLRDRWRGQPGYPYIRAAGTWLTKAGTLPGDLTIEVADADGLLAAALAQLDDGADLVKLYLDGPDAGLAPWSAEEVRAVVAAVHAHGATVAAHGSGLANCKLAADARRRHAGARVRHRRGHRAHTRRERRRTGVHAVGDALVADLRKHHHDGALRRAAGPVGDHGAAGGGGGEHQDRAPGRRGDRGGQ